MTPLETSATDETLLAGGALEVLRRLPGASNETLLVRVSDGEREALAVYKPQAGEAPLWDFPDGTLCHRETAAWIVARSLGWPPVPATVMRDGPFGPGAVSAFVPFEPGQHYFTLSTSHRKEFRRIAAFDVVVNNADRKGGHCLLGSDGRIWAIDHGVCFSAEPKLRTVIWEFAGKPVPDDIATDLARLTHDLRDGTDLHRELSRLLAPEEVKATRERAARLAETAVFPRPGLLRSTPWPPV